MQLASKQNQGKHKSAVRLAQLFRFWFAIRGYGRHHNYNIIICVFSKFCPMFKNKMFSLVQPNSARLHDFACSRSDIFSIEKFYCAGLITLNMIN